MKIRHGEVESWCPISFIKSLTCIFNALRLRPTNIGLSSFFEEKQFQTLLEKTNLNIFKLWCEWVFSFPQPLVLLRRLIVPSVGRYVKHTCLQDFLIAAKC